MINSKLTARLIRLKMSKKIEWNWGTKLVIAIIIFMSFIFMMVYLSVQNPIDLVEKDYYPKGLKYQTRIDEIQMAESIQDQFVITQANGLIILAMPEINPDSGSIVFFRPSNHLLDFESNIQADSTNQMYFPLNEFKTGLYTLKVHWYENAAGYYVEKKFSVN